MTEGSQVIAPVRRPAMPRRIAPALGLFFLAPLVGEYLVAVAARAVRRTRGAV